MKSKPAIASNRDQWRDAFPLDEAQRAAKFLHDTWEDLVLNKPKGFHRKLRENQLTEKLYLYLDRLSQGQGRLTGFWINENTDGDLDDPNSDNPQLIKRIRKDITYLSNTGGVRLVLIFEFKKISSKSTSWRQYRGEDGMRRFVDGIYARGLPLALMVGMLMDDHETCVKGLKLSLQSKESRDNLRMVSREGDNYLVEPSSLFSGLACFDTEHSRPADRAPSHGTMLLAHMFVTMPLDKLANPTSP